VGRHIGTRSTGLDERDWTFRRKFIESISALYRVLCTVLRTVQGALYSSVQPCTLGAPSGLYTVQKNLHLQGKNFQNGTCTVIFTRHFLYMYRAKCTVGSLKLCFSHVVCDLV
jgi:hypothetical protein